MRIERHIARATLATILFASPLFTQQTQTGRVLGVFDDASGQPVVGAEVVDLATKSKTMTSESGVATLAFLSSGTTVLQVRKVGYKDKMLTVVVSPNDTASLTVLLKPVAQALPTVVTKGTAAGVGKLAEFDRRRVHRIDLRDERHRRGGLRAGPERGHVARGGRECAKLGAGKAPGVRPASRRRIGKLPHAG